MKFREKLRRGRSHLLIVVVMLITAAIVVGIEDENLSREAGKTPPDHQYAGFPPADREPVIMPTEPVARLAQRAGANDGPGSVVQIGAYRTREDASAGWAQLVGEKEGDGGLELDRIEPEIVEARAGGRPVYRLLISPDRGKSASQMCRELHALEIACFERRR